MEAIKINVYNIIADSYGIETEEGQKVYEYISKALNAKQSVDISFYNIEMLTTAFLNSAIGQLYKKYSEDFIKQHVAVSNISDAGAVALKRVVETAKTFYNHPEILQKRIDEIIEE